MSLQEKFEFLVKTLPHLPLPENCLVISDLHAAAGDDHDPFKGGGMEPQVLDMLEHFQGKGYALLGSEFFDVWRGYDLQIIYEQHRELVRAIDSFRPNLFWVESNHSKDLLTLPPAYVFEGYGKKVFLDHGHFYDYVNCQNWKVGRLVVRTADKLGIDPETSPHPSNPERHKAVMLMRQQLADANPEWDFFWGHTHWWLNVKNNHNSGCGYVKPVTGFLIQEGNIIPLE